MRAGEVRVDADGVGLVLLVSRAGGERDVESVDGALDKDQLSTAKGRLDVGFR
jgi:hypothetical protein